MIKNDLKGNPDYSKFIYFDFETDPQGNVIDAVSYTHLRPTRPY